MFHGPVLTAGMRRLQHCQTEMEELLAEDTNNRLCLQTKCGTSYTSFRSLAAYHNTALELSEWMPGRMST